MTFDFQTFDPLIVRKDSKCESAAVTTFIRWDQDES
jgi:hypothetical protein